MCLLYAKGFNILSLIYDQLNLFSDKKNTRTENYTVTFINDSLVTGNGEGNGTPLQYSCLENPIDGEAW